ncbi:MAG: DNA polymerase III subunit gamma/tau [Sulfurovaceae bacterium]|nr:DNA polymerase III subunit gamma/tau [Sulfurovaceae bacterium]MDD5548376.1 DNA polymerase III subunit gamma/tau [Sulfurovaceae bacterium]
MSLVLARKYRPNLFADLIGQDSISSTLSLALDSKRLSHAYLFSGLRGSGKTSTARIFAKALICDKGETSTPCNECPNCNMANENRHMDIIEMDAASNRGIDDIKELIEHSKYRPSSARYKIFIIDEVHMLTPQAFNALLKTLEEPPPFVKFILATTDPLKLPATILSRTQHFRFKKIPHKLVVNHLEYILNLEGIEYENDAIEIIARSGAGSLRDSLTLLDQAIVYSKNFVDVTTVTNMLGIIEPNHLKNLISSILAKDLDKINEFIKMASEYECEMILDELTLFIKDIMFAHDKLLSPLIIERFFRVIANSKELLKLGSDGDFVLYLTLFKMMESLELRDIDSLIKELQNDINAQKDTPKPQHSMADVESKKVDSSIRENNDVVHTLTPTKNTSNQKLFENLKTKIFDRDFVLGSCFERTTIFDKFENDTLYWISSANDEDKEKLKAGFGIIRKFVQDIFGDKTQIKNTPSKQKVEADKQENIKKEQDECKNDVGSMIEDIEMPSSCIMPEAANVAGQEKNPEELMDEPMVKEAIDLFNPKKVTVVQKI